MTYIKERQLLGSTFKPCLLLGSQRAAGFKPFLIKIIKAHTKRATISWPSLTRVTSPPGIKASVLGLPSKSTKQRRSLARRPHILGSRNGWWLTSIADVIAAGVSQYSPMIHSADEHTLEERISLKLSSSLARMMGRNCLLVSMISRTKNTTSSALAVL